MSAIVTTHDIELEGRNFIMELTRDEDNGGWISLTEGCDDTPCEWFVNDATTPSWCCNTHQYDGTGDYPATGEHPEVCDFSEYDEDGNCITTHETFDFQEYSSDAQFSAILAKNNIAKELKSSEPNIRYILSELKDIEKFTGTLNQPSVEDSYNG